METNEQTKKQAWWILFPLQGISISNKRHDLHRPVFRDATILSSEHLAQIAHALRRKSSKRSTPEEEAQTFRILTDTHLPQPADAFLAVRRFMNIENEEEAQKAFHSAEDRAYEVASALSLVFVAASSTGRTCGLTFSMSMQLLRWSMFQLTDARYDHHLSIQMSPFHSSKSLLLRRDLRNLLFQSEYRSFSKALLFPISSLPPSLSNTVREAAIHLSEAIHATTPEAMILGAVTSTEVLLSLGTTDFKKQHQYRIFQLVGDEANSTFQMRSVFEARHAYVHRAKRIDDWLLAQRAVALALSCILRYAEVAGHFSTKDKLVAYLDFLHQAFPSWKTWNDTQKRSFQKLVHHTISSYDFGWMPRNFDDVEFEYLGDYDDEEAGKTQEQWREESNAQEEARVRRRHGPTSSTTRYRVR